MKVFKKQTTLLAAAFIIVSTGATGVAAANSESNSSQFPVIPAQLERALGDLGLTDEQKEKLAALQDKRKALKDEFWAVFTEAQKTAMLEKLSRHHRQSRHGEHDHNGKRDREEWRNKHKESKNN